MANETRMGGGMLSPVVLYGKPFDWDSGREAMGQTVRDDGSVNWRAAFAADPGCGRCPKCHRWLWREGRYVRCPHADCGHEFGWPTEYQQREINRATWVLRELAEIADGIDNGTCKICKRHRFYLTGRPTRSRPGPCENPDCLSHRITAALNPKAPDE